MTPVLKHHNVRLSGRGTTPMVFAHGFGCDQTMWRFMAPAFETEYRIVLFDYVGHGHAERRAYDPAQYETLSGYAADVLAVCKELGVRGGVFVGHSVSGIIGALAAIAEPQLFEKLIMIGPSPRYLDDDGYTGGFTSADIDELSAKRPSCTHLPMAT